MPENVELYPSYLEKKLVSFPRLPPPPRCPKPEVNSSAAIAWDFVDQPEELEAAIRTEEITID